MSRSLSFANLSNLKEIYRAMQAHEELKHVRQDKLRKRIEANQCIYHDGVAITFQQYKKRTRVGDFQVPAGAIMIHQIVNAKQFSGKGGTVFERFFDEIVKPSGGDLYLSVRKKNAVACSFYERHGMVVVGKVDWAGGTLPGLLYRRETIRNKS
jgi:hypothetical protein